MKFRTPHSSNQTPGSGREVAVRHPLSPGGRTYALLDANVLVPPRLSDILFDLCLEGLFWARWSMEIEAEFVRNWSKVAVREGAAGSINMQIAKAKQRLDCYKNAVRAHEVYGHHTDSVLARVPTAVDAGDRHVAAAALVLRDYAVQENTRDEVYIVSSNVKHLASADLEQLGVSVIAPGKFIDALTQADSVRVARALEQSINCLKIRPYTHAQLLQTLALHRAERTVTHFADKWLDAGTLP
jgi:hypothetical protein